LYFNDAESERHVITVVGIVVVAVTVVIDIPEVVLVVMIRRTKPPVVRGANESYRI